MCQGSLLADSGELCTTFSKWIMWDRHFVYELPMSAPLTSENEFSLLPTPQAQETGRSEQAHRQMKADLPGGARTQITSLAVLAKANFQQPETPLLPTPGANDATGGNHEQMRDGGSGLRGIAHLLPVQDPERIGASTRLPLKDGKRILGRPAPRPTDDRGRLTPAFVEWMLGFDHDWTAGVARTRRLQMLGNSVMVQVAELVGKSIFSLDGEEKWRGL